MKLTYQEMLDTFGTTYFYDNYPNGAFIEKKFKTSSINQNHADSLEEALALLRADILKHQDREIKKIEDMREQFKTLSFSEKLAWQIKNKHLNFDSTAEERKIILTDKVTNIIQNIEIRDISPQESYTVNTPYLVKEGDTLFVVVTDQNALEAGIYEARVIDTHYFNRREDRIELNGLLSIEGDKEYQFNFSGSEHKLISGHTYHHIFQDKDAAIDFHNETIGQKIKSMQESMIKINQPKLKR